MALISQYRKLIEDLEKPEVKLEVKNVSKKSNVQAKPEQVGLE